LNATRTIQIRGQEHPMVHEALMELNFTGDQAISIANRFFTVDHDEFVRLQEEEGIVPTTHHLVEQRDGRETLISVPGNC